MNVPTRRAIDTFEQILERGLPHHKKPVRHMPAPREIRVNICDRQGKIVASTAGPQWPDRYMVRVSACPLCDVLRTEGGPHVCAGVGI